MQSRVAIIGANGFVGRHLLRLMVRRGLEALGVVRSEEGARVVQDLGGTPFRVKDLEASSTSALAAVLEGSSGLVYTASVTAARGGPDRTDPSGLQNVLDACRAARVPRVVFLSGLGVAHYGMNPHCTNPYFLAKMAGEIALFRSGLEAVVFRPSYIFGAGDEFLSPLVRRLEERAMVEIPGSGEYRLQPISVVDAARALLAALEPTTESSPRAFDLVGPEVLSYRALIGRIAAIAGRRVEIRERAVAEAEALARATGYFGLRPHDLACLLCDEVSDPGPISSLIGSPLEGLDAILIRTITELRGSEGAS
jgi:NADH dehydrogenase